MTAFTLRQARHDQDAGDGQASSVNAGFSLLEVIICTSVLAIAIIGASSAILSSYHLDTRTTNETLALAAAEDMLAQIRQTPFDNIVGTFSGQTFSVPSLDPLPGGAPQGEVIIIDSETPNELNYGRNLGVPGGGSGVDVDGNGRTNDVLGAGILIDDTGRTLDIDGSGNGADGRTPDPGVVTPSSLIPVVVLVRWGSSQGIQRLQTMTVVVNRAP